MADPRPARAPASFAVKGLFALALVVALYYGRALLIPLSVAVLLNLLLSPAVRWLRRTLRVPQVIAATLVLGFVVGAAGYGIYQGAGPAHRWMQTIPQRWGEIERKLTRLKAPLDKLSEAGREIERAAQLDGMTERERKRVQVVTNAPKSLARTILWQGWQIVLTALLSILMALLTLLSGESFLSRLVETAPNLEQKKRVVIAVRTIERSVSSYLAWVTAINIGLGAVLALALWIAGFPNPILFGALAGIVNFIPYAGPLAGIAVVTMVSLLTYESTGAMLVGPGIYLAINTVEAYLITPAILGKNLSLEPVVVFGAVLAWGMLWGMAGAFLAVPLVMSFKIACDHIDGLRAIGSVLGPAET